MRGPEKSNGSANLSGSLVTHFVIFVIPATSQGGSIRNADQMDSR